MRLHALNICESILHPSHPSSYPAGLHRGPPYMLRRNASPKVIMPAVASTLRSRGSGFLSRIARGIDAPPRMTEASRLSSTPYGWRFWMR